MKRPRPPAVADRLRMHARHAMYPPLAMAGGDGSLREHFAA